MRRWAVVVVGLVVAVLPAPPAEAADPSSSMRAVVTRALRGSSARQLGYSIHVEGLGVIAGSRAALPPASLQKLSTAGAALRILGPSHVVETVVRFTGALGTDGVLDGDLVLVGGGDAGLTGAHLGELAATVAASGVRHVTGSVFADDSRYDPARAGFGWKATYVGSHSGPLSSVAVDGNRWRRDAAYLADPVTPAAARFREALSGAAVTVAGADRGGRPERPVVADAVAIATHRSPPLAERLPLLLAESDNFAAELLLKELGVATGRGGSTGFGLDAVAEVQAASGLVRPPNGDGSGLSSHARMSSDHVVGWLQTMADSEPAVADAFTGALAVGCTSGTLRTRFCNVPGHGIVRAKTGTLPAVATLAGYTTTASGRRVTFAFLSNGCRSVTNCRVAIDRAVTALTASTG